MNQLINVFLDTDIGPDCDDTAALAILLQLCKEGHARLLGITHCTGSPYGLGTIDAICRMYGIQVPMGTCDDPGFLSTGTALCYTPSVCEKFANSYPPNEPHPDAVDALVQAMESMEADSVTMITIGPLNNLARFLTDKKASLLMCKCVRRIVMMAGSFVGADDFTEWNIKMDISAMRTIANLWKKELILCPFEAAVDVNTGAPLAKYPDNPVKTAYSLFNKGGLLRPSWDLLTVACAVLDDHGPYALSSNGYLSVSENGVTRFTPDAFGNCSYIYRKGTVDEAVSWLDTMLENALQTMTKA
ncbi:MAG: nucleoside hydrolase [Bacillota bacterium]|nr:nucleoside hydrolase [Bacillota bacterium]